jgi:hypothetical protein
MNFEKYANNIEKLIHKMITNDLTIGRSDNNLPQFTDDEIKEFILINNANIKLVIENIINDYSADNELESLENPLYDWIGEYLYEIISYS